MQDYQTHLVSMMNSRMKQHTSLKNGQKWLAEYCRWLLRHNTGSHKHIAEEVRNLNQGNYLCWKKHFKFEVTAGDFKHTM
jgi:hypothetical protein